MGRRRQIVTLVMLLITSFAAVIAATPATAATTGPFQIRVIGGGFQCLQPEGGNTLQGTRIVQTRCDRNNTAQHWMRAPVSGNVVHFVNIHSGLCLNAHGAAARETPVDQWPCNGISNENWEEGPDPGPEDFPPLFSRVSGTKSLCLDVPFSQETDGLAMWIHRCNNTSAQKIWISRLF
ncbi:RICIN domain-containing protein [Lentzea tibetensis]|nr:RICIN domain-containing protein [Lentzea tibetensis]